MKVLQELPEPVRTRYHDTWKEAHEGKTQESKIARQLDKIEMVIQALEYETLGAPRSRLNEFWSYVRPRINDPDLVKLLNELEEERESISRQSQ